MAQRRIASAGLAILVGIAAPACRFSGGDDDKAASTATTSAEILATLDDDSSTSVETTTTVGATSSTGRTATTLRTAAVGTTRAPAPRPATTRAPASPHCNASAANAFYGSTWTVNVSSTFPNSTVTIDLKWPGGSGNYSGYTDPAGSWSKTQRVQPSMRGQRVDVSVVVASVRCATSFTAS